MSNGEQGRVTVADILSMMRVLSGETSQVYQLQIAKLQSQIEDLVEQEQQHLKHLKREGRLFVGTLTQAAITEEGMGDEVISAGALLKAIDEGMTEEELRERFPDYADWDLSRVVQLIMQEPTLAHVRERLLNGHGSHEHTYLMISNEANQQSLDNGYADYVEVGEAAIVTQGNVGVYNPIEEEEKGVEDEDEEDDAGDTDPLAEPVETGSGDIGMPAPVQELRKGAEVVWPPEFQVYQRWLVENECVITNKSGLRFVQQKGVSNLIRVKADSRSPQNARNVKLYKVVEDLNIHSKGRKDLDLDTETFEKVGGLLVFFSMDEALTILQTIGLKKLRDELKLKSGISEADHKGQDPGSDDIGNPADDEQPNPISYEVVNPQFRLNDSQRTRVEVWLRKSNVVKERDGEYILVTAFEHVFDRSVFAQNGFDFYTLIASAMVACENILKIKTVIKTGAQLGLPQGNLRAEYIDINSAIFVTEALGMIVQLNDRMFIEVDEKTDGKKDQKKGLPEILAEIDASKVFPNEKKEWIKYWVKTYLKTTDKKTYILWSDFLNLLSKNGKQNAVFRIFGDKVRKLLSYPGSGVEKVEEQVPNSPVGLTLKKILELLLEAEQHSEVDLVAPQWILDQLESDEKSI